jgi:phosphoribosylformylglycinamidine cyclo-ligase
VKAGNVLVALPSSGVHSNGFSLVRKILQANNMDINSNFEGKPIVDTLLTPTRIYVKEFKKLKSKINALAHITGGGIVENLPRVLPENIKAVIHKDKIQTLPIFDFMSKYVEEAEMYRTFNMGVGLILVVEKENLDFVLQNSDGYVIGELVEGNKGVKLQ